MNLDSYNCNQIESISSDYGMQHPPPPPPNYYDENKQSKKSKRFDQHEPIPDVQILNHNKPPKKKKKPKKKDKKQPIIASINNNDSVDSNNLPVTHRTNNNCNVGRSITPPPHTRNNGTFLYNDSVKALKSARSVSPPSNNDKNMNGKYGHKSYNDPSSRNGNHDYIKREKRTSPPLTSNIAKIEKGLKTWNLNQKSPMFGYHPFQSTQPQNLKKAQKILGVEDDRTFQFNSQNRRNYDIDKKDNNDNYNNDNVIKLALNETEDGSSMNKNNSNSICSIESLEADDGTGLNNRGRNGIINHNMDDMDDININNHHNNIDNNDDDDDDKNVIDDDDDVSMSIKTADIDDDDDNTDNNIDNDSTNSTNNNCDNDVGDGTNHKRQKPKIRMFNALAYGLEALVEGKTYEWVDSKYVRLLQLSTYSTVMGPKVKFVWKNSEIYNINAVNRQNALNREHKEREKSKSNNNNNNNEGDNDDADDDDDKTEEKQRDNDRTVRPELAFHELEAWIAKQTLDCTEWKNKQNKTAPPPFTKKAMIAPEFGVVLSCIQFDSSLRALRNKQFNQYLNGICSHTPANINHHNNNHNNNQYVNNTPKSKGAHTPNGNPPRFNYRKHQNPSNTNPNMNANTNPNASICPNIPPTSSPYEHTGLTDDGSPNQFPTSSAKSYTSSRYSSPSGYQLVGDTLADYLSKFAPFSFSAGISGGMNISGANIPQIPYNHGIGGHINHNMDQLNNIQQAHNTNNMHHIDDNEDPDDIGHYSLVLAVEYKYYEKFIDCLDAIEHWLYIIASQIRYLLALNKCFKCDQINNSMKLSTDFNTLHGDMDDSINGWNDNSMIDEDCPDKLHTIIPFMTNIAPTAIFKFDQLFSATFVGNTGNTDNNTTNNNTDNNTLNTSSSISPEYNTRVYDDGSVSMSSSYLMMDPRYGYLYNMNYIPSRGLPQRISLFDTWFTKPLDNRDKHKLSTMISSHLQTLGRTLIIGDNEADIDRYISTMALFSTQQQRSLSRLSVKVDDAANLCSHYIPELYLQGIVIPQIKAHHNNNAAGNSLIDGSPSNPITNSPQPQTQQIQQQQQDNIIYTENDYNATITYLQSSSAMKQLQEDLYLAPGPSTLVLLTSSFWLIRQTAMPHKFKQEQQGLLFQKLFYLRRRKRRNSASSYIYARKRSAQFFDSPSRKDKDHNINNNNNNNNNLTMNKSTNNNNNNAFLTPPNITNDKLSSSPPTDSVKKRSNHNRSHERTLERKRQKQQEKNPQHYSAEFRSIDKVYRASKTLNEEHEHNGDTIDLIDSNDSVEDERECVDDELIERTDKIDTDSITATSQHSAAPSINSHLSNISASIPQPIHAPHLQTDHKNLTFVEPSLSPMIATIVFGSFNIPQELKMTFLETQFRILLEKASEILLYIEHEQKDLLSFYDKTCHVMSCKEFKEQVPMEALYPQIMQKFESQLRNDLQITRQEDLYVLLSISEGFRPNLFSLMFGNPVFDIEVADILRYFLF